MRERGMFIGGGEFHSELKRRVAAQLTPALIRRGRWRASFKGLILTIWALASWSFLVFVADTWWMALLGGISLALGTAGVAFSVGHDANHGAFFPSRRWNRIVGYSFDLIGASSYVWRTKHNVAHHTFTNVDGADTDIDQMPFARLAPSQPHKRYHRFQHIYMWALYGLFTFKFHLGSDVGPVFTGKIGQVATIARPTRFEMTMLVAGKIGQVATIARPTRFEMTMLVVGKVGFWSWAVIVPLFFQPWWAVALMFVFVSWVLGIVLAVTFQLAHAVDEATFTDLIEIREGPSPTWAAHQVESTVDFATRNRFLGWYLGGLNFQIEHHLFPKVCHVHYPRILQTVRDTCDEFGVRHVCQPTMRSALVSHGRWLRAMGRGEGTVPVGLRPPATPT